MSDCKFDIKDGVLLKYSGNEEHVVIPAGVTEIGNDAFWASNIKSVFIPEGVTTIRNGSFWNCYNLMKIYLPSTLITIEDNAFLYCNRLVEIYNLSSINIENESEDNGKVGMRAKVIHTSLEEESSIVETSDGYLFISDETNNYLFGYIGNDSKLNLPSDFNGNKYIITEDAFCDNSNLLSVVIPESVIEVDKFAFDGCHRLVEIYNLSSANLKNLNIGHNGEDVRVIHKSLEEPSIIIKENGYTFAYFNDEYYLIDYKKKSSKLILPHNVKGCSYSIYDKAFLLDHDLEEVIISDGVTSIGRYAFEHCTNLREVKLGNGLRNINMDAFLGCKKLTNLIIPESVKFIDKFAFDGCYNLV